MIYTISFSKGDIIISIALVAVIGLSTIGWHALISLRNDHVDNAIITNRVNSSRNDTKINDTTTAMPSQN